MPYGFTNKFVREEINTGYVYSMWSGRLIAYKGTAYTSIHEGMANFYTESDKKIQCSTEPGTIYNAVIWLTERDDELAKKLLIDYEEKQISKLQEKIDNHRHKIKTIKEGAVLAK